MKTNNSPEKNLLIDLAKLIEQANKNFTVQINSSITILFWQIGKRITKHILQNKRAEYGKEIVVTLSRQLKEKYGRNFEERNLRRMIQFSEQFPDFDIVMKLANNLSWSHFIS